MTIVISGGLGYIGGRLSKYFCEKGHAVIALSRQSQSLPAIQWPPNLTIIHPEELLNSDKLKGADIFIHLAAMNENDCLKYPAEAININITQTLHWLEKAHYAGIKKFIYFSTVNVYGNPLIGYFDEQSITKPIHPYAITHRCAEDYVLAYASGKKMDNIVIRLTNSFGGPAFPTANRWTLLVNDLCRSAVTTGKMILLSDGTQMRDFVCLEDVCRATLHLINLTQKYEGVYNFGTGISSSVWDMALNIKKIASVVINKDVLLERAVSLEPVLEQPLQISINKLLKTGFQLLGNREKEIQLTLEYFRNDISKN